MKFSQTFGKFHVKRTPFSINLIMVGHFKVYFESYLLKRMHRTHPFDWLSDKNHFGVPVYHFGVTERALGDPHVYPENRGFCMPGGSIADCRDAGGVLNAASASFGTRTHMPPAFRLILAVRKHLKWSIVQYEFIVNVEGAPLYMSWPHFFLADRRYTEAVRGLHEPSEDFRTYIDIEPVGCTMHNHKAVASHNAHEPRAFNASRRIGFALVVLS